MTFPTDNLYRRNQLVTVRETVTSKPSRIFPDGFIAVPGLPFHVVRQRPGVVVVRMKHGTEIDLPADVVVVVGKERAG